MEFKRALPITKNITIKSVVDNLRVIRGDKEAYLLISSGITLNINESSSDKKIVFTDSVNDCILNYMYGLEGNIVVYNAVFTNISCGAILANDVKLTGCAFSSISSTYGAIHVMSERTATIESCTFSGNESTQNSGYGDIYLAKGSEDTNLTLSGTVTTDIGIYVANESCGDPEINVDGIELSSNKLNIKLSSWPEAESITLFVKNNGTFTSVGDMDSKYTFVVFPDSISTMPTKDGNGQYMTSLDGTYKEYMVIKY